MIVGCYDLHLYCDGNDKDCKAAYPAEFSGRNASECFREARKDGWKIDIKTGKAYCLDCKKQIRKAGE